MQAESYCLMEQTEALLDCCEQEVLDANQMEEQQQAALAGVSPPSNSDCGTSRPPNTCSVGCAER